MPANCDGRYPHYLRPLSEREPPARIVCVDPRAETALADDGSGKRTERLLDWSAVCLRRKDGLLLTVSAHSGQTTSGFWTDLAEQLAYPGVVWVVSWQCTRAWALLGLWDELETRRARVSGGDHRAVADPSAYGRSARPGMLVAEDPPCLAQLRLGARPGQVLWLDCRNWGIELSDERGRGKPVAERLADLVKRLDVASVPITGVPLAPTAGGQAWRGWRKAAQGVAVHCHVNPQALKLERSGHVGGRCECFHIGKLPYSAYHLDFRSHYGAIMRECPLPVRLAHYYGNPTLEHLQAAVETLGTLARVTIETDEAAYPLQRDFDTIYPEGTFTTTLCGPELLDAVAKKRVRAVHELATYEMEQICSNFAERAYAGREAADARNDKELSSWCKSIINALPGKLGYRLRSWETRPGALAPEPWGEWHQIKKGGGLTRWRALAGICQQEIVGGYGPDAIPSMAIWITSHGRFRLLQAVRTAGRENVGYIDTDALILSAAGVARLAAAGMVENRQLGRLELRAGPVEVEIRGIKYYLEGETVRCAGLARGVQTTSDDGRGNWYTPAASEGARRGEAIGAESVLQPWPRPAPYRHGVVCAGGVVRPFFLKGE